MIKIFNVYLDESYLIRHFQSRISELFINMKGRVYRRNSYRDGNIYIFIKICNSFKNLQYLNFSSLSDYEQLTFGNTPSRKFSSNLLELHVVIKSLMDCLCLLDDHFNQLHTLHVTICPRAVRTWLLVNHQVTYSY